MLTTSCSRNPGDAPPARTSSGKPNLHVVKFSVKQTGLAAAHQDFASLALELENDASMREGLAEAGAWVAEKFYPDENDTIRSHRLRKGFSQLQLASLIGTSQPHIANIEKGNQNVMFDTVIRLCEALEITPNDFQRMVTNQRSQGLGKGMK